MKKEIIPYLKSSWKTAFLFLLSICQTINYINHIPYLLLYLPKITRSNVDDSIFIIFCFIIYDIVKYLTKIITAKFSKIIGQHQYYMISLLNLSIINGLFYIVSIFIDNIFIYTFYRSLISIFNNIASFINLPISALYKPSENHHMLEIFSFMQKFSVFLFFFFFAKFYHFLSVFNNYYLISAILNLLNFIFYYLLHKYYSGFKNLAKNQYFKEISEVSVNNSVDINTSQKKINQPTKTDTDCQTMSTSSNFTNDINSTIKPMDLEKEKIFILANSIPGNSPNDTINSQTFRNKKIKQTFFIDQTGITKKEYNISKLSVVLYTSVKIINYFSLFMLIMKSFKINQEEEQNVTFEIPTIKLLFKFKTKNEAILFLFMFYYLLIILVFFINKYLTSCVIRVKYMNYLLYYSSALVMALSSYCFIFYYFDKEFGFKLKIFNIFLYEFIISECSMIILIVFNIKLANKNLKKNMIKDMKSMGFFFAAVIFLLSNICRIIIVNVFGKTLPDEFIFYSIFIACGVIIVMIDFFLNKIK